MKNRSSGAPQVRGALITGAADAVLGTDAKGQNSMYDTRSGTLLTVVLLFLLGWIPMIGQMVSGYIGGRRAGSPARGLFAAFLGTVIVIAVMFLAVVTVQSVNAAVLTDPEGEIAAIAATNPALQSLLDGFLSYTRSLFGNADFSIDYGTYALAIPFGAIGGIVADQCQKEARLTVSRTKSANAHRVRSLDAMARGTRMGFESYEKYTAMSVNAMSAPAAAAAEHSGDELFTEENRKGSLGRRDPVTATVDTTRVQSSPTSSGESPKGRKSETGESPSVYI